MTDLPRPKWADEMEAKLHEAVSVGGMGLQSPDLTPITDFSTLFAEYEFKGNDLLVHLFPRKGSEDRWYPDEVRDGKYIPARREEDIGARFPKDFEVKIKSAADEIWQGEVSIQESKVFRYDEGADVEKDEPKEVSIGSFAVQFQSAKQTAKVVGVGKFMDQFCEELDARLEPQ